MTKGLSRASIYDHVVAKVLEVQSLGVQKQRLDEQSAELGKTYAQQTQSLTEALGMPWEQLVKLASKARTAPIMKTKPKKAQETAPPPPSGDDAAAKKPKKLQSIAALKVLAAIRKYETDGSTSKINPSAVKHMLGTMFPKLTEVNERAFIHHKIAILVSGGFVDRTGRKNSYEYETTEAGRNQLEKQKDRLAQGGE